MKPRHAGPIDVPPRWRILASPVAAAPGEDAARIPLVIAPGTGFGDGTHETTQLCLQAIAALAPRGRPFRALDFGAGSGILSIAAAKLGASVVAVEIDEKALEEAKGNARGNAVADRVSFARTLEGAPGTFDLVVANILRAVLVRFAGELVARLAPGAALVLCGLVATDVPEITARYAPLLGEARPDVYARGEWRAVVWRRPPG